MRCHHLLFDGVLWRFDRNASAFAPMLSVLEAADVVYRMLYAEM